MTDRFRIALAIASGAVMLTAQVCYSMPSAAKPKNIVIAVDKNGQITYDGHDVTCEQMNDIFRKLMKGSKEKFKPLPCHEYPYAGQEKVH
jgi:biopolymer transport protein ExbD